MQKAEGPWREVDAAAFEVWAAAYPTRMAAGVVTICEPPILQLYVGDVVLATVSDPREVWGGRVCHVADSAWEAVYGKGG